MTTERKISTKEITVRLILFLIFASSAILKLIVGFENIEIGLAATDQLNSWIEGVIICNLVAILEISCATIILFGKYNNFQNGILTFTFILYIVSILGNLNAPLFQEFTLLYLGHFIANLIGALLIMTITLNKNKIFKIQQPLLKWYYQLSIIITVSAGYILLGSLNTYQFKDKTEAYHSGVSDWAPFNSALQEQHPELLDKHSLLVAFFSVNCSHCQLFAKKIRLSPSSISKTNILYVFWAEEEDIKKFMKENDIEGPYLKLPQNDIMHIVGQQFPVFYTFEKGKPTMEYMGSEFSYAVLDKIFGN